MTNVQRLAVLNNRYERLLELNAQFRYTSGERCNQYLQLLLAIRREKQKIWLQNRENPKVAANLEKAKSAVVSLTRQHLFNLTNPRV
jgi:hypothetical protein